jgi:adenine specific DNA methylase Mod
MARLTWAGKASIDEQHLFARAAALQTLETLEGPEQEQAFTTGERVSWHNRLICGDKSSVLPALLKEFANGIALIYIDPPFMTGRDFNSGNQLAYSDKWKNDMDAYLQWLYETLQYLYLILAEHGSLYIHLDWRVAHYARVMLDEIFGYSANAEGPGFKSEIIWH